MSNDDAIKVEHVSKSFKLPHNRQSSIKGTLINLIGKGDRTFETQEVLKDISFEVKKGEFFGIVGRNGSGKSTLLKMLAGIYTPTKGDITVNGSLTPFIELGVGFNPELTGRENVYMNGALLGFDNRDVDAMYDDIVSFAELERFMDQKLKNYSSGMQVRLAFSIAIRARSDILLIDEVLAVGDVAFQRKCYDYFDELKQKKQTIVLVTHDMGAVRQFCNRAMLLDKGKIVITGEPDEVSVAYERLNYPEEALTLEESEEDGPLKVWLSGEGVATTTSFEYGKTVFVNADWSRLKSNVSIAGVVLYKNSEVIFATNTFGSGLDLKKKAFVLRLDSTVGEGRYKCKVVLFGKNRRDVIVEMDSSVFTIFHQPKLGDHDEEWEGVTYIPSRWEAPHGNNTR